MTTTEPLQFSVITAPLAAIDRRALSQAWYSALYRQNMPARKAPADVAPHAACARTRQPQPAAAGTSARRPPCAHVRAGKASDEGARAQSVMERRQIRSSLARKVERVLLHAKETPKSATFRISGVPGRVHVILREGTRGLQLVAICSRAARPQVSAALEQARYALASRGIAVDAKLRCEEPAC